MRIATFLILIGVAIIGFAQDSTAVDTITRVPKRVFQPGLYLDYGKAINSISSNHSKLEGAVEFVFWESWQIIGEYGSWNLTPPEIIENGNYSVEGTYYRIGFGFIPYVDNESRVGLGFRYAESNFTESGAIEFNPSSGVQPPPPPDTFSRPNLKATWYEAVFYSDKKFNNWMTLGFTARVRFLDSRSEFSPIDTQIIPGYGNTSGKRVGAFNLFVKFPF